MPHPRRALLGTSALAASLFVAACVSQFPSPVVNGQVSLAALGSDILNANSDFVLAVTLIEPIATVPPSVQATLTTAETSIEAFGNALQAGNVTTGTVQGDVNAADRALQSVIAGIQVSNPALAQAIAAARVKVLTDLSAYDAAAAAYNAANHTSLPVFPVPTDDGASLLARLRAAQK